RLLVGVMHELRGAERAGSLAAPSGFDDGDRGEGREAACRVNENRGIAVLEIARKPGLMLRSALRGMQERHLPLLGDTEAWQRCHATRVVDALLKRHGMRPE